MKEKSCTVGFEQTWRCTNSCKWNLLNELVFCNESMPVRINKVTICAHSSDGKIICPEGIRTYPIQSLLSLSTHINITLLAQPDTVCTTLLKCWLIKEELWISQKFVSLPWQRRKHLNIYATYPAISCCHLQTGSWRLSRAVFCNQLCFCWQRVPVPGEEKSCSEEKISCLLSKKLY